MSTFATTLTAAGAGAIGVILIAGPDAHKILAKLGTAKVTDNLPVGKAALCAIRASDGQTPNALPLDEALVIRTGESRYELHLHGGIAVMEAAKVALQNAGARIVDPGEAAALGVLESPRNFAADAPASPVMEGELLIALSRAQTAAAAELLLHQPAAWKKWTEHWTAWLGEPKNAAEFWRLQAAARWVLDRSYALMRFLETPRVAIVGAPSVGKSTLANALLGRRMSITSERPGTTRDWVDAQAVLTAPPKNGRPPIDLAVTLVDTAGIRETTDPLESESIARTHHQAAAADVIIAIFDATRPPELRELTLAAQNPARTIFAANKMDSAARMPPPLENIDAIPISAKTGAGLDRLMHAVLARLDLADTQPEETFAFNPRLQKSLADLSEAPDTAACRQILAELPNRL